MAERDDPPPSYDPRSWMAGTEPRREQDDEVSFDPRSWADPAIAGKMAPQAAPAEPGTTRSAILAGAVALVLFSVGGAAAYLARQEPHEAVPVQADTQQPEVVVEQEK